MDAAAKLRMDVYQEGQRAYTSGVVCPYNDWREGTWKKGCADAEKFYEPLAAVPAAQEQAQIWVSVADRLPKLGDYSVLAYWQENGGIDMVHVQEYFGLITDGLDENDNHLTTQWYLCKGVTHWMPLPATPQGERAEQKQDA